VKSQIVDPTGWSPTENCVQLRRARRCRERPHRDRRRAALRILCRRTLKEREWRELKAYSDSLGLAFFCTALFDARSIFSQPRLPVDQDRVRRPQSLSLLRQVARTGLNIQLDTGNGSPARWSRRRLIRREGNENIIIHHCPSGYPARLQSINLRVITTLRQMFPYPIAYSDHTPGWDMDIAAVTLGASLVERPSPRPHHPLGRDIMSLEPAQMAEFIKAIRNLETALGSPRRVMHAEEIKKRQANRRSMY